MLVETAPAAVKVTPTGATGPREVPKIETSSPGEIPPPAPLAALTTVVKVGAICAPTVRVTGIVRGVVPALTGVSVTVPLKVPWARPIMFTPTVMVF
jgi:hypothetical protein